MVALILEKMAFEDSTIWHAFLIKSMSMKNGYQS